MKDLAPPHGVQEGKLGKNSARALAVHDAQNADRTSGNNGCRKRRRQHGLFDALPRVKQHGYAEEDIHAGIDDPEPNLARKRGIGKDKPVLRRIKDEKKQHGHERGIECADPLHSLSEKEQNEQKP